MRRNVQRLLPLLRLVATTAFAAGRMRVVVFLSPDRIVDREVHVDQLRWLRHLRHELLRVVVQCNPCFPDLVGEQVRLAVLRRMQRLRRQHVRGMVLEPLELVGRQVRVAVVRWL